MTDEDLKITMIALVVHSWWIIPVIGLIFVTIRERFKEARENGEPISHVFGKAGTGCIALILKGGFILLILVIAVQACDIISGPSYEPEYEAWRY